LKLPQVRFTSGIVTAAVCIMIMGSSLSIAADADQVIKITAKRFVHTPREITVKKGQPVVLEFTTLDRLHGFNCPDLGIRTDIPPGKVTKLRFVPKKVGTFPFHCDTFCGSGHEGMTGTITVKE
jgi:cytochrome c oxidase subunit 2